MIRTLTMVALAAGLAACTGDGKEVRSASADAPGGKGPGAGKGYDHDPFPSTYRAYPGRPTLVTNVTILDGEGGRIDRGSVLFRDGRIVEVGRSIAAEIYTLSLHDALPI